jgi:hypothetical protein
MGYNFPSNPTIGDLYPTSPAGGTPQYRWDGEKWAIVANDAPSDGVTYGRRNAAWSAAVARGGDSMSGNLIPSVNGNINLGSATFRWGTIYTSDLSLNNGIGDWTIVEGEDDLFLYNNKRGKVYKFMLYEIAPATAPPRKA